MAESIALAKEFHDAFNIPTGTIPGFPTGDRVDLRVKLIDEEFTELKDAIAAHDIVGVFDALLDLQVVLDGTFLEYGLDTIKLKGLLEVHRANMSKLGEDGKPIVRPDGKVLKGPNYSPPDLASIILDTLAARK